MAFEVFQAAGTRHKSFISVTENKTFGLSRAFIDKHGVKKEHRAVVLYDPEANQVALHFTLNNPSFSYGVQIGNERHGAIIAARNFFDIKGLDAKLYAGRYDDYQELDLRSLGLDKDGKAYVLTLRRSSVQAPARKPEEPIDTGAEDEPEPDEKPNTPDALAF